jgi:hypothetical protein
MLCLFELFLKTEPTSSQTNFFLAPFFSLLLEKVTRTYAPLEAKGTPPSARSHAVAALVGGRVLVTGGQKPRDYRTKHSNLKANAGVAVVDDDGGGDGESSAQVMDGYGWSSWWWWRCW